MKLINTPFIGIIFIVFQCYGIYSQTNDEDIKREPKEIAPNSMPINTAGYMTQQVTRDFSDVGQMFYYQRKTALIFPINQVNGSMKMWNQNNGKVTHLHIKEISNETLAIIIPTKQNPDKYIIGSNRNLRLLTITSANNYYISEPLIYFNDTGFVIYSAHSDLDGKMFILLIGKNKKNKHLGKFYQIENKKAKLLIQFDCAPRDFRFNNNYTYMYIVNDNGRMISDLKYNKETGKWENKTELFNMNHYPKFKNNILTSVTVDRDIGNLWVTAAGKNGYVLEINPFNKTICSVTPVPNKDLTFLTFGYTQYKSLFVGSKNTCVKGPAQGAIYAISGTGKQGVADRPIQW